MAAKRTKFFGIRVAGVDFGPDRGQIRAGQRISEE